MKTSRGRLAQLVAVLLGSIRERGRQLLVLSAGPSMVVLGLLASRPEARADLDIHPVGNWPGPLRYFNHGATAVVGRHALVTGAVNFGLYVFDVGNAAPPRLVGSLQTIAPTKDVVVVGHHAFVTDEAGRMLVVDISEVTQPRLVSVFDTAGYVDAIGAAGTRAYLAVSSQSTPAVHIVDISIPARPSLVGTYVSTALAPGDWFGTMAGNSEHLCIARGRWDGTNDTATLEVVDIQDPAKPRRIGLHEVVGRVNDANSDTLGLTVADGKAYFATALFIGSTWRSKIEIIDLRDPSVLKLLGSYTATGVVTGLAVSGEFLYASRYSAFEGSQGAVDIIRVSDPSQPVRAGGVSTSLSQPRLALGEGILCLATSAELRSFDISQSPVMTPLGTLTLDQWTADVAVSGNHAFTADLTGLSVLDASDPANLTRIGKINAPYPVQRIVVSGNYAYLAAPTTGLITFDVSNLTAPRRTSTYSAHPLDLAISGKLLFVVGYDGFYVLDLTNPATPRRIGYHDTQYTPYQVASSVAVSGNHAFVASSDYMSRLGVLEVFDVSTPSAPQLVGSYDTTGANFQIAVSDKMAVLARNDGQGFVDILDVSEPSAPTLISSYIPNGGLSYNAKVSLVGNRVYIPVTGLFTSVRYNLGLEVIDLGDPSRPRRIGGLSNAGETFAASGENLFASYPGVQTLRLTDATLNRVGLAEIPGRASSIAVEGSQAYVAAGTAGLQVLDVGNPNEPSPLGSASLDGTAWDVAVADQRAYVAAGEAGLVVLDVSNPQAPQTVGAYDTPGDSRAVLLSGSVAYVADGSEGVHILDVSDPTNIQRLGSHATTGRATGLAKQGNYLLVACCEAGLAVLDVSNPASPQLLSTYNRGGYILAVAMAGNHALVSDGVEGFAVLDLTNPSALQKVGSAPGDGDYASGISVSGRFAYVAVTQSGVEVYDLADRTRPRRVGGNSALPAYRVSASGNRLFVAGGQSGLGVFEPFVPPLQLGMSPAKSLGTFNLLVDGPPGSTARIQSSTDLRSWSDWRSVTLGEFPQPLADETTGPEMQHFYRAVIP